MRGNVVSIQFLRFVAATLVVTDHATEVLSQRVPGSVSPSFFQNALFGASGVHIFFVISGFIMVYTSFYKRNDGAFSSSAFLSRRFLRIYPIYFIYCALYIAFYYKVLAAPLLSPEEFAGALLLLPGYASKIIGPGWTLAYEIYFYLCFGVAMVIGLRRGLLALTAFFFASIVLGFFVDTSLQAIFVYTNTLLIEFLFGAWIGYAIVSGVRIGNFLAALSVILGVAGFLAGIVFGHKGIPSVVAWGVPSALLIAGAVFAEFNGRVTATVKKFSFLGDTSYSLYLIHVLLLDVVVVGALNSGGWFKTSMMNLGTFGAALVCCALTLYCIVVAWILYELIEKRFIGRLRDMVRKQTRGRAEQPNMTPAKTR